MSSTKVAWTSDPDEAKRLRESARTEPARDTEPSKQMIRVTRDRKQRGGKTVTVARGFQHTPDALAGIAASLKKKCGSGGTAKGDGIEIQGDHVERVAAELKKLGYRIKT